MTDRRVRFTATARGHVERLQAWWIENRDHQHIFISELEDALYLISRLPGAGSPYERAGVAGLRRVYLRKVGCHLYYTYDDREVIVRALWSARRGYGPVL